MASIITTLPTFKKYVRIVYTSTDANGLPNMDRADRKYLVPVLGQSVYTVLLTKLTDPAWATLLDICRSYVAPMAMLLELPTRNVQITDSGIKKTTSTEMDNVFKWEYLELKESLETQAAEALDELWQHLISNGTAYSWVNPLTDTTVISSASEFKKYYPSILHMHRVFPALQPIMIAIQDQYMADAIGAEFFASLLDIATPDAVEKEALELIKKAVAHLTIMQATIQLPARLTPNGFTVQLSSNSDATDAGQLASSTATLSTLRSSCESTGGRYIMQLKEHLNANASQSVFTAYYNSEKYVAPGKVPASRNGSRTGSFGF